MVTTLPKDSICLTGLAQRIEARHGWNDLVLPEEVFTALRRDHPVFWHPPTDQAPGGEGFWVLTRHADVLAVSRDNTRWLNTPRSVLGPDEDWERLVASGMPVPASLVHLDGAAHRGHRAVTNDWFKPAAVRHRQPRELALARAVSARTPRTTWSGMS